ncbi:MAG: hypothetical protein RL334_179, partial [Chloroflexota bacterium]
WLTLLIGIGRETLLHPRLFPH